MLDLLGHLSVKLSDEIASMSFIIAAIGVFFASTQLRRSAIADSTRYLSDAVRFLFDDEALSNAFYQLDYNQAEHIPDINAIASQDFQAEASIDKLLYTLDLIGHMLRKRAVSVSDVEFLAFRIDRVFRNSKLRAYLVWLVPEYKKHTTKGIPKIPHANALYLWTAVCRRSPARSQRALEELIREWQTEAEVARRVGVRERP